MNRGLNEDQNGDRNRDQNNRDRRNRGDNNDSTNDQHRNQRRRESQSSVQNANQNDDQGGRRVVNRFNRNSQNNNQNDSNPVESRQDTADDNSVIVRRSSSPRRMNSLNRGLIENEWNGDAPIDDAQSNQETNDLDNSRNKPTDLKLNTSNHSTVRLSAKKADKLETKSNASSNSDWDSPTNSHCCGRSICDSPDAADNHNSSFDSNGAFSVASNCASAYRPNHSNNRFEKKKDFSDNRFRRNYQSDSPGSNQHNHTTNGYARSEVGGNTFNRRRRNSDQSRASERQVDYNQRYKN